MEYITLEPSSEVIIAADADKAGREAARRAAAQFAHSGRKVRIAIPERYKDWNEDVQGSDPHELQQALLKRLYSSQCGCPRLVCRNFRPEIPTAPVHFEAVAGDRRLGHDRCPNRALVLEISGAYRKVRNLKLIEHSRPNFSRQIRLGRRA
jgi:hypothetical protein